MMSSLVKKILAMIAITSVSLTSTAQVQIGPLPESGYDQRIRDYVNQMKIVDTHEHLLNPSRLKESDLDFMLLFRHYAADDYFSVGLPDQTYEELFSGSLTAVEKWHALQPYWDLSFNTGYNRAGLLAADKLFGIKKVDETTVEELSQKIKQAYQTNWFDHVLKQKCNIEFLIEDYIYRDWENRTVGDPNMIRYVRKFDDFILIDSKDDFTQLTKWARNGIQSLNDLETALNSAFADALSQGFVGVKSTLAYIRSLHYANVDKAEALSVFNRIMNAPGHESLPFEEVKPLQDYMMHRVLNLADTHKLPVQLHTGLNNGNIEIAKPTLLTNLFQEYPDVRFILFHGSYPYGGELSVLAKKFNNVYIDLCWLYIVSPSYSERYLHEWLETVPASKIMAFGGDYMYVENVYSHLLMAREVLTRVLTDKVATGYFSEEEAMKIAGMLLHDNAVRVFGLKR